MTNLAELLADIDTATAAVCAQCDGPLAGSPSDDFCGERCQEQWHALRAVALTGYREPLEDWATLGPPVDDYPLIAILAAMEEVYQRTTGVAVRPGPVHRRRGLPADRVVVDEVADVPESVIAMAHEALAQREPPAVLNWAAMKVVEIDSASWAATYNTPVEPTVGYRPLTRRVDDIRVQYAYRTESGAVVAYGPIWPAE